MCKSESEAEDTEDEQMSYSDTEEQEVHKKNSYKMQLKKFEVFKAQNPKTGHFDVIFDLNGKYLYAHKFDLTVASETLNSWLSDPWRTTNDPIRINTYSFDIFFQLCCFLYSGGCTLTNQNIFQIIDASEFFGIQLLKSYCKRFIEYNEKEIIKGKDLFEMLDSAENYSLPSLKKYLKRHCLQNFDIRELLENDRMLEIKKSHLLSILEAQKSYSYGDIEEKIFEAFVKWTENYIEKKKEDTNEENLNVEEALENEFKDFLPYIKFDAMNLDYLVEFLAKKPYLFSPSNLVTLFTKFSGEQNERFKAVYQLAEAQALRKQKASNDKNFDLFETIKCYMTDVISATKFSELDLDFVVDFLRDKSFVFSFMHDLYKLYANCKRRDDQEEQLLKTMYELAEREVSKKLALLLDNSNIIQKAIKEELSEFLPNIKFHLMNKTFLMDFVVPKGICTYQQALNVYMLQVEVKNENNSIIGIFNDNFDILKTVGKDAIEVTSNHGLKQRFENFKFPFPSEPSELKKKDEIEWYLCFEADGILTVKHQSIISETDYLIAELKTINNGKSIVFKKKIKTSLKFNILNEQFFEEIVELPTTQQPPQKSIEPQKQQQQPPNQQEPSKAPQKPHIQTKRRSKNRRRKRNTFQNANINHHQNLHSYHPYIRPQNQQQVHQPHNQLFHQPFVQQIQQQIDDQQFNNSPNYNIPFSPFSQQHNYYPRFPGN